MQIACQARAEGCDEVLGVIYDRLVRCDECWSLTVLAHRCHLLLARQHWEDESGKLGNAFDLATRVHSPVKEVLRRAEAHFVFSPQKASWNQHSSHGKGGRADGKQVCPSARRPSCPCVVTCNFLCSGQWKQGNAIGQVLGLLLPGRCDPAFEGKARRTTRVMARVTRDALRWPRQTLTVELLSRSLAMRAPRRSATVAER